MTVSTGEWGPRNYSSLHFTVVRPCVLLFANGKVSGWGRGKAPSNQPTSREQLCGEEDDSDRSGVVTRVGGALRRAAYTGKKCYDKSTKFVCRYTT